MSCENNVFLIVSKLVTICCCLSLEILEVGRVYLNVNNRLDVCHVKLRVIKYVDSGYFTRDHVDLMTGTIRGRTVQVKRPSTLLKK